MDHETNKFGAGAGLAVGALYAVVLIVMGAGIDEVMFSALLVALAGAGVLLSKRSAPTAPAFFLVGVVPGLFAGLAIIACQMGEDVAPKVADIKLHQPSIAHSGETWGGDRPRTSDRVNKLRDQ